jgi:aryl-alcohol dehydrogenase-like predicted oxidoreductase
MVRGEETKMRREQVLTRANSHRSLCLDRYRTERGLFMQDRFLGKDRLKVSAIGYGCPPFQGKLTDADESHAIRVLRRAIDIGINFIDSADHNNGNNEEILAKVLKNRRGEVVLTTKFGNLRGQPWAKGREVEGKPEYVGWACENSLKRLQTDYIDLYYLHRVDPKVPIEDTVGAMARLVEQGKVRHLGLSEAGPETLRRANAVHPIAAVQSEYSLWTREYEANTIPDLPRAWYRLRCLLRAGARLFEREMARLRTARRGGSEKARAALSRAELFAQY